MSRAKVDRRDVLKSAVAGTAALGLASRAGAATAAVPAIGAGRGQDFDRDWRFHRGEGSGFEAPGLDDGGWRKIDLPHDWSIEDLPGQSDRIRGPFDRDEPGGTATAFMRGGEGWYRKHFRLSAGRQAHVGLDFDGVYMNAEVWCNGVAVGGRHNGYTPFTCDLTQHLSATGDNVIAVRVRSIGKNSRWYAGAGIYRHVRLNVHAEASRIARWGVSVATQRITGGAATIALATKIESPADGLTLHTRLLDARGHAVWEASAPVAATVAQTATIASAALWSPDAPNLYTCETTLRRGATVIDTKRTPFGARIVTFASEAGPDAGMAVNGKPTKLRGGCIHHDNGLLGAAAFDAAEYRKVALLKARGYNALRPSHNLFGPALLDACDQLGVMVIGETFDMWREHKIGPGDFTDFFDADWQTDLDAMVLSARHHPSIVMWSIGNEIPGRNQTDGVEMQWKLTQRVHTLDPTRPVTAAVNGFAGHEITLAGGHKERTSTAFLDVVGYNYKLPDYEADRARFPGRLFFGTESFPRDVFAIWELTERTPWLIGDFVWTAMDYLGEAGIGGSFPVSAKSKPGQLSFAGWPWVNAFCGDIDLIGAQKAPSLARDVAWGLSTLEMTVQRPAPEGKRDEPRIWGWHDELDSWTWPETGRPMTVRLYTSAEKLELQLNGHTVGTQERKGEPGVAEFTVPYAPGVLEAVAWRGARVVARKRLETAGAPVGLKLRTEKPGESGRGDVSFVMIEVVDAAGRRVPDAEIALVAEVKGAGEVIGLGSANPLAAGGYQSGKAKTWHGRALAVVRGKGAPGRVGLSVSGTGLAPAMTTLKLG